MSQNSLQTLWESADTKRALESAVGHEAPFSRAELAECESVRLRYVADISIVQHLTGLLQLSVIGSEVPNPGVLKAPRQLFSLRAEYSGLGRLDDVWGLPEIETIRIDATPVSVLPSVSERPPKLYFLSVSGCPLEPEAYAELNEAAAKSSEFRVALSDSPDWAISRLLHSRKIRAVYRRVRGTGKVGAPGLAYSQTPDLKTYQVTHDDVKRVLDQVEDGDLKGFMDRCRDIAHGK